MERIQNWDGLGSTGTRGAAKSASGVKVGPA